MKRTLAALSAFAIVGGLLVSSGPSEPAQASGTPVFALDCTNTTSLKNSLEALANATPSQVKRFPAAPAAVTDSTVWVFSGFSVGGSLTIRNTATRPDFPNDGRSCLVRPGVTGTQPVQFRTPFVSADPAIVSDQGGEITMDVLRSGVFTVEGNFGPTAPELTPVQIRVDACSLTGSGIALDPWRVGSLANLGIVGLESGASSCLLSGHYLQTANISDVNTYNSSISRFGADVIAGTFTGTYDGDHYGISYTSDSRWEDRPPLFETLGAGGVIKRLSLSGLIRVDRGHTTREISSLVGRLDGGLISEVGSTVNINAKGPNPIIGGLVARAGATANTTQRIQYSAYGGRIDWTEDPNPNPVNTLPNGPDIALVGGPTVGGLVGMAEGATSTTELRDSYARAQIFYDSGRLNGGNNASAVFAGGLIGSDGLNDFNTGTGVRTQAASLVKILRSYAAGSFTNTCSGTTTLCNTNNPTHVFTGGLIGVSEGLAGDEFISAFALSGRSGTGTSSVGSAVGRIVSNAAQPLRYTAGGFPQAAMLSSTFMQTLSTYQSKNSVALPDEPSGSSDLQTEASTGTLAEQDYRWAIETGTDIETFVASSYATESNYLTRTLFADTSVTQFYPRQRVGVLDAHGGRDLRDVTGYPTLGRVWEICQGQYPVLVWEERDCPPVEGPAGRPGTPTATAGNSQATVQITPPTTGGSPVTYTVTSTPGGETCTITVPETSCTVTGLTNGTSYTFSSTATGVGGTSEASASSNSVTPGPAQTVTFDANGGTGTMSNQTASSATALTNNGFTRSGFTFAGWSTSPNGSVEYAQGASFPFSASVKLYAVWTSNSTASLVTSPASTRPGGRLATTGVDVDRLMVIGLLSVMAGSAFLAFSRRKRIW